MHICTNKEVSTTHSKLFFGKTKKEGEKRETAAAERNKRKKKSYCTTGAPFSLY